ncbi:MAG: energy transducer TonB, partial [Candidatus Acidiferrales bacterium]
PLSAQIQALLQEPTGNPSTTYPRGGKDGYSNPACLYCPAPVFTSEAVQNGVQGVVHLLTVVDSNGRVQIFSVQQGLPYGLTLAAIRAVRTWRLRPATGPDGKPAAVRVPIEVSFHLFR